MISCVNTYAVGASVHLSGVVGMTEINGLRGIVLSQTSGSITVDIDSSGFSAYSSGGVVNTRPQDGETVTGGCEFDIPAHFAAPIDVTHVTRTFETLHRFRLWRFSIHEVCDRRSRRASSVCASSRAAVRPSVSRSIDRPRDEQRRRCLSVGVWIHIQRFVEQHEHVAQPDRSRGHRRPCGNWPR